MPFWRIWHRERVQFNDGNICQQTIDSIDLIPDKPGTPRDIFVGPLAMEFGFGIFDEHVLESPGCNRQDVAGCSGQIHDKVMRN